jgi:hypothetical protein
MPTGTPGVRDNLGADVDRPGPWLRAGGRGHKAAVKGAEHPGTGVERVGDPPEAAAMGHGGNRGTTGTGGQPLDNRDNAHY